MKTIFVALLCLASVLASQSIPAPVKSPSAYSQIVLLQNWALSRCLAQVYTDSTEKDDASASASAYLEYGTAPIGAYDGLTILINKYATRTYQGSVKSGFNTMKCIDLFQSKELAQLTKKIAAASSRRAKSATH